MRIEAGYDDGSDLMQLPRLMLHHVDVLNDEYISGWAFNRLLPRSPLRLHFRIDGETLGETTCNRQREDVLQSGMHPTGSCGFEYRFRTPLDLSAPGAFRMATKLPGVNLHWVPLGEIQAVANPTRPIFFMHIPKTAGTSFNNHVHGWFGYGKWHSHIEVLPREKQMELLGKPQYVAGHLPFFRLLELPVDLDAIDLHTILREPYRQLHSHLAWLRGVGLDPESAFFRAHPPAVRELALSLRTRDLSTPQGLEQFVGQIESFQCDFFDNIQVRYLLDSRPDRVAAEDLDRAIAHLSRFCTIGVTERYEQFVSRCAAFYGRRHVPQSTRHNPSRVAPLFDYLDESIRVALLPLVRHDQVLYEHVMNLEGH